MNLNQEKQKIAFLLPELGGGGAERSMLSLANQFSSMGFPVDFLVFRKGGSYEGELADKIRLTSFDIDRALKAPPHIANYLKENEPYAILGALEHVNVALHQAIKRVKGQTKLVATIRNHISKDAAHPSFQKRIELMLARKAYLAAHATVAVSHGVAQDAEWTLKLPKGTVKVIYNPVITDDLAQKAAQVPEHPWFPSTHIPVILGVGRLNAQKDWPTLIEAVSIVRQTREARLVILGEGELRGELQKKINSLEAQDWIDLPGFVDNPFSFMGHCSVFVLSSQFEGLPGVLIQALASGATVVSTDCPSGPREILKDGRFGQLVPVGSPVAMAQAIGVALESPIQATDEALLPFMANYSARQYLELLNLTV